MSFPVVRLSESFKWVFQKVPLMGDLRKVQLHDDIELGKSI